MEQSPSNHFGVLLGLPLIAIGLVVVVMYFVTGDQKPASPPASVSTPQVAAPAAEPLPPQVSPARPPPAPPPVAPAPPSAPAVPAAAPVPPPQVDAQAVAERFQDPKVREHAHLMVAETAKFAIKQRDLAQLQHLRDMTRQQALDQVLPPNDVQAMDLGIDCLTRTGGFQARAEDFFEDHPSSVFNEVLRAVCQ